MRAALRPVQARPANTSPPPATRLQELSERELKLLAYATGTHVPIEVRLNLDELEHERLALVAAMRAAAGE